MMTTRIRSVAGGCLMIALLLGGASPALAMQSASQSYDLPAQPLGDALAHVARQSQAEIIAPTELVDGLRAPPVKGSYDPYGAIIHLLRGSGLFVERVGDAFVIRRDEAGPTALNESTEAFGIVVTGSRIRGHAPTGASVLTLDRDAIDRSGYATTQQLLQSIPQNFGGGANEATLGAGTRNGAGYNSGYGASINLRGLGTSSTLVLFDGNRPALGGTAGAFADLSLVPSTAIERVEILADGASAIYGADAVAGVVNILFRNRFEGAETRLRFGTADGDFDEWQASQIVGGGWATGHAVVAYEYYRRGALAAADRPFVTEDLRRFGGPDYRSAFASPGTIIAADGRVFGIPKGQDGTALTADRLIPGQTNRFDARSVTDVIPRQRTHSLFASLRQDLGEDISFYARGLVADRRFKGRTLPSRDTTAVVPVANPFYVDPIGTGRPVSVRYDFARDLGPNVNSGKVTGHTVVAGLLGTLGGWSIDLNASYGRQEEDKRTDNIPNSARLAIALADPDPATAYNVFGDGPSTNPATIDYVRGSIVERNSFRVWSGALRAEGPLFDLPAGAIRLAVGSEYRDESFDYKTIADTRALDPTIGLLPGLPGPRQVTAGYAELLVPVFGGDAVLPGIRRLDLSLAGRVEHYSDFGTTTNPKFGISWSPVDPLTLRASYGTSFRAPNFTELSGPASGIYAPLIVPDPASPTGQTVALALFAYAPDIGPEEATSWTAGFDWEPIRGLRLSATWFDIAYRDRIASAAQDYLSFLAKRDIYGGLVTDNPDPAIVAAYYAAPIFSNPFNIPATDIAVILDGRTRNLSETHQSGLDFSIDYLRDIGRGQLDLGIGGTWLTRLDQRLTPTAPAVDVLGTFGNPADLRLRGRLGWTQDGFSLYGHVNHVSGYDNLVVSPAERVHSWTTFDLQLSFAPPVKGLLSGTRFALSATNLFDRAPPYVHNRTNTSALGYDPEQASAVGRVIALQLAKSW